MDKAHKPMILSVIYHRQNPLDSTRYLGFQTMDRVHSHSDSEIILLTSIILHFILSVISEIELCDLSWNTYFIWTNRQN
jgi:hypothetical protein